MAQLACIMGKGQGHLGVLVVCPDVFRHRALAHECLIGGKICVDT